MTHSWGQRVVLFYDPDGNLIEVGTPMQLLLITGVLYVNHIVLVISNLDNQKQQRKEI